MKRITFVLLLVVGSINNLSAQKMEPVTLSEVSDAKLTTTVDSLLFGLGYSLSMIASIPLPEDIGKFTGTYAFLMARPNDDPNEAVKGLSGADPLAVTYFIKTKEVLIPMITSEEAIPYKSYYKGVLHKVSNDTSIIKDGEHLAAFLESAMNTVKSNSTTQKINDTFYGVKLGCSYNSAIATLSNKGIKYYSQNNEIIVLDVNFSGYDFEGLTYEFNSTGCYRVRFITTSSDAITNMEQYANFIDMANKAYGSPFTTEENKQGYKDNKTVCVIRRFFSSEDYLYYFGLTYTMESSVAVAQPNDSIGTESYIQPPTTMTEDDPYDASNDVYDPWLGTLNIDGAVYRTAETKAMLTLEKNGTDTYKGRLIVLVGSQDMDTYRFVDTHGSLDGKVRAKSSGRELLVTLVESESYAGDETNLFDGVFNGNDQIFKIVYDGSSYTTTAIGKMEYFYDGANIYTTK